jgi:hypothetical protein
MSFPITSNVGDKDGFGRRDNYRLTPEVYVSRLLNRCNQDSADRMNSPTKTTVRDSINV